MSQMNDILTRVADIQIGIEVSGLPIPKVLQAEPYQPSDMSSVSCPFFVNELMPPGRAPAYLPIAAGQQYRTTIIGMLLCLARKEANIDLKYGVENTVKWAEAVFSTFSQHVRLSAPAKPILSSTNANPIKITTTVPHRYNTGDQVTVSGHLVNTPANGTWNVTVVDYLNFMIPVAGIGAGGQTGQARLTQPLDMVDHVVDAVITSWNPTVLYPYGSTEFLAPLFELTVREMYVVPIVG